MSKEGDKAAVFRTTMVRTKLKGDCSWMQRQSNPAPQEEKPWMAEVRACRLNGAPIETSPVSSPTKPTPSDVKPATERTPTSGYLIRGIFTKTDSKPAPSSTANGSSGTTNITKKPSESYKKIAPHTVKPSSDIPAQTEAQLSADEQERRTEAASNVLKRSAVRQRSYVFSAAKKYESTEKAPDTSPENSSPSFVAKRVEITDDDGTAETPAPASTPPPTSSPAVPVTSPVTVPEPTAQATVETNVKTSVDVTVDGPVVPAVEDIAPEPVKDVPRLTEDTPVVTPEKDPFENMKPGCTKVHTPLPELVPEYFVEVSRDPEPDDAVHSGKDDAPLQAPVPGSPIPGSAVPVSPVPVSAVPVSPVPVSPVPVSAVPVSAVPVSPVPVSPVSPVPVSPVPVSAVPVSAVPVSPVPVSPVSPVPVPDIPVSAIPVSPVPVSAVPVSPVPVSPVSPVPVPDIPVSAVPVSAVPVSPVSPVPVPDIPVSPVPVSAVPVSPVPVSADPVSPVPVSAVPVSPVPVSAVPVSPVPVSADPVSPVPVSADPVSPVSPVPVPDIPVSAIPVSPVPVSAVPVSPVPVSPVPVSTIPVSPVPVPAVTEDTVKTVPEPEPSSNQSSCVDTLTALSDTLIPFSSSSASQIDTQEENAVSDPVAPDPDSFKDDEPALAEEEGSPVESHMDDSAEQEPTPELSNCLVMTDDLLALTNGPEELPEPTPPSPGRWSLDLLSGPESLSDSAKTSDTLDLLADDVIPINTEARCFSTEQEEGKPTDETAKGTQSLADPFDPYPIGTTSPNSSSDLLQPLSTHSINSSTDLMSHTDLEDEDPSPEINMSADALESLAEDVIPIDTGTKRVSTDRSWTHTWEAGPPYTTTDESHDAVPAGRVEDQQTLVTFERKSSENDSPWDRWTSPTVYTTTTEEEEEEGEGESPEDTEIQTVTTITTVRETFSDPEPAMDRYETYSRTWDRDEQRIQTPEPESKKGVVLLKEYVNATELSSRDGSGSGSDYLTSSSTSYSYRSPSTYSRDSISSTCTYCGELVGNDGKITIEHLNIDCHPACFKCGVCSKPMGDLIHSMFLHGGTVHCESCYSKILD